MLGQIDLKAASESFARLRAEVGKVVVGQQAVIEQMLIALLARGHCLLIGVPGLAKTLMVRMLAEALDMRFKRIQFTPDMMPSDITGTTVLDQDQQSVQKSFRFLPGPLFTNMLLADEINRTPPKTQAALLEAMQERQVTFGGQCRQLPDPFLVLATQNPLEQEGTYPLPEAQLDRFMFSLPVSYTTHAEENRIVVATTQSQEVRLDKVLDAEQVLAMQAFLREVPTPAAVIRYAVALARASRPQDASSPDFIKRYVDCGGGPRAGQYLTLAAKSRSVMMGQPSPSIEDVRAAAIPVLRHRMFTNFTALSENITADHLISKLLKVVPDSVETQPIVYSIPASEDLPKVELAKDTEAVELIQQMKSLSKQIRAEVQQAIVGQHEVVDLLLAALLAGGHCLLVGVPGLAKTTLVHTMADVLDLDFKRVQFTPDLMPSDITGTDVMETNDATGRRQFRFIRGPVFTNMLLADEINRTPPKTQAALLEAMQELAVTAGGTTYPLEPPFFVLATQNPLEQEGTYPLPEAQLDRFMFDIHLGYPSDQDEPIIVERTTGAAGHRPRKVIGAKEIVRLQHLVRKVPISPHVLTYVTTLVRSTRPETKGCPETVSKYVHCGASPRAAQYLVLGAKARAVMRGRANVSISDVRAVAVPVMRHRIFTNFLADAEGVTPMSLIERLLRDLPEPRVRQEKQLESQIDTEGQPAAASEQKKADMVTVQCPQCSQTARLSRQKIGHKVRCHQCEKVFRVGRRSR